MSNPLRTDKFYHEDLIGLFGPIQIMKYEDISLSGLPTPKLLLTQDSGGVDGIWIPELDKWAVHGDVGYLDGRGHIRVMLSKLANSNTLLVTEQCDNLCLFCSQPPKKVNDEILFTYAAQSLISFNTQEIVGISGGEPLLNNYIFDFFHILNKFQNSTPLHILSNGRAFSDIEYTSKFYEANRIRNTLMGIPLYSTKSSIHDKLVGCIGAWEETIKGIINAGNKGIEIEVRIIPTKDNFHEIHQIVEMFLTCCNSISQISIMNLEQTGWAKKNWNELYIDVDDYSEELSKACFLGDRFDTQINLFNYPLCHIPKELYRFAQKSISDWKNTYPDECNLCDLKSQCGGFFSSIKNKWTNPNIRII